MKITCLLIALAMAFSATAQTESKVVFFTIKAPSQFHGGQFFRMFYNNQKIGWVRNKKILVYTADKIDGDCAIRKPSGTFCLIKPRKPNHNVLTLKPGPNTITFVHGEVELARPFRFYGTVSLSNLAYFKNQYDNNKWFRKSLHKAGYKSVEDLVGGLTVNE